MADLDALLIFAKVVEANSFSEAARRLQMPTSTVSRRVSDLEDQLGVRLLERSTRILRLTNIGADVLAHAQRGAAISDAVETLASDQRAGVSGLLRVSAFSTICDSLIAPLITSFQSTYPSVRVQILVTDRPVDLISEGVDVVFRSGPLKDCSLVARRILTYRHQLVASPGYLAAHGKPSRPEELLGHRLIAFGQLKPEKSWTLVHVDGKQSETLTFSPFLSMNDYSGLASALLADTGIGELPPIVQPELLRSGRLVEVLPDWRFPSLDVSLVHLGNRHVSRPIRLFKELVAQMAPTLFPELPA